MSEFSGINRPYVSFESMKHISLTSLTCGRISSPLAINTSDQENPNGLIARITTVYCMCLSYYSNLPIGYSWWG